MRFSSLPRHWQRVPLAMTVAVGVAPLASALVPTAAHAADATANINFVANVEGEINVEFPFQFDVDAPATIGAGANYTESVTPGPLTVPASETVEGEKVSISSIQGATFIYPIPAGATYVSSSLGGSGDETYTGPATGSVPLTVTYCTAAGPGCTASATSSSFAGNTPVPYVEVTSPGNGESSPDPTAIPGGATVTFPALSVQLTAPNTASSSLQQSVTEFDVTATIPLLGETAQLAGYPSVALGSPAELGSAPPAVPAVLATTNVGSGSPTSVVPEAPSAILLPLGAAGIAAGAVALRRRRQHRAA